jgi:hypothetical protein
MESEQKRFFQYLGGERLGEVVIFDKVEEEDGQIFIVFKDGSRCDETLIIPLNQRTYSSELLAEVENPQNIWTFKEEWIGRQEEKYDLNSAGEKVCVLPFLPGRKKITPIPPKPTTSRFGKIDKSTNISSQNNITSAEENKALLSSSNTVQQSNLNDPVYLMCEKAKKFDSEISMTLIISLPKKSLYNVAKESFENGGEKVIEYIIQNLDNNLIKESLKQSLLESYEETSIIEKS